MNFDDLLAPIAGEPYVEDALGSWDWLGVRPVKLLLATAFGDVFVLDASQSVWFLDIIAGTFGGVIPCDFVKDLYESVNNTPTSHSLTRRVHSLTLRVHSLSRRRHSLPLRARE